MTDLSFSDQLHALAENVDTLYVIGRQADLKDGWPVASLSEEIQSFAARLAEDAQPGRSGGPAKTLLPGNKPGKLVLVALHDEISRHLSPARTQEIYDAMRGAVGSPSGAIGIVLALENPAHAAGAARGLARAFPLYQRKTSDRKEAHVQVVLLGREGPVSNVGPVADGAAALRLAQRLVDMPTSELDCATFEAEARGAVKSLPHVTVDSIVGDDLLDAGLRGLHAVGRTASVPPRIVCMDYNPPGASDTIAVVGKGLVYDTGGLSLKIVGDRMLTMKCDMGGAAAVLGAFVTLVKQGVDKRVVAVLSMAENAIGTTAYRPDDVIEMHSGKTVEINNTDAEGRLALADASSWVCRKYSPSLLIDAATLTGAQLMATGKGHAGICATDGELESLALAAGLRSGDHCLAMLWSPELLRAEFKSKVADMRNSVADRMNASSAAAGLFVWAHVEDLEQRFLHIDLAGPAFPDDRGTGYGVGLISEVVSSL